jgi:hypothetical protein
MPISDSDVDEATPSSGPTHTTQAPILVTGAHRSGSTWVGKMLAATPEVGYIKEPFHLEHRPGVCAAQFERWFAYVTDENAAAYDAAFARTLAFDYDVAAELTSLRSPKDVARMARDWSQFAYHRRRGSRPLMKDPLAFFSAEWLAERFAMDVVVIVRHPAAFVSSLSRVGWWYDVRQWLEQPLLMRDLLGPFEEEIHAHVGHEQDDVIAHAALLWKVIYATAQRYREEHPDWIFVHHEDLSRRPTSSFRDLYDRLGLSFTPDVKAKIEAYSGVENPAEAEDGRVHQLRRDSRANIWNWAERLSPAEVEQVRRVTDEVAAAFYTEDDWMPPDDIESAGGGS